MKNVGCILKPFESEGRMVCQLTSGSLIMDIDPSLVASINTEHVC